MLVKFEELYQEAIALSTAKKQFTTRDSSLYEDAPQAIKSVFGNKHRLIFPLKVDIVDVGEQEHPIYNDIRDLLIAHGYLVETLQDYIKGVAFPIVGSDTDQKNPHKIGKLLSKFAPTGNIQITDRETRSKKTIAGQPLLHAFKMDPIRQSAGKYFVVISRHPYDIAGMSTDRNWTSCMDMGPKIEYKNRTKTQGSNWDYVAADVKHGSIIAYLVSDSDRTPAGKIALRRPLSRILMKPYISSQGQAAYGVGRMYGVDSKQFAAFVEQWVAELNRDIDHTQLYTLHPELYFDIGDRPVGFQTKFDVLNDIITSYLDPMQESFVTIGDYQMGQRGALVPVTFEFEVDGILIDTMEQQFTSITASSLKKVPIAVKSLLNIFANKLQQMRRDPFGEVKVYNDKHNTSLIAITLNLTIPITRAEAVDEDVLVSKLMFLKPLNWSEINYQFHDILKHLELI